MGKWEKIRWILRGLGGAAAAVALAPVPPLIAIVAAVAGAAAGGLSVNLPRDVWSAKKRAAKAALKAPEGYDDGPDTPPGSVKK